MGGRWTYGDERGGHLRSTHGHGTISDLLDLLTDWGKGEHADLGHGAIGAVRCQPWATLQGMMLDLRLHGVGGCNGSGRGEGGGYGDRCNLTGGDIRRRESRHDQEERENGDEGEVHCEPALGGE